MTSTTNPTVEVTDPDPTQVLERPTPDTHATDLGFAADLSANVAELLTDARAAGITAPAIYITHSPTVTTVQFHEDCAPGSTLALSKHTLPAVKWSASVHNARFGAVHASFFESLDTAITIARRRAVEAYR